MASRPLGAASRSHGPAATTGDLLALEALATWHGIGHEAGTIACLEIVARTALANGETETGVRLLALVTVCSERPELGLDGDLLDHQSQLEIIRERLGQQVSARAWNEGRNLTIEEAVTIASGES